MIENLPGKAHKNEKIPHLSLWDRTWSQNTGTLKTLHKIIFQVGELWGLSPGGEAEPGAKYFQL